MSALPDGGNAPQRLLAPFPSRSASPHLLMAGSPTPPPPPSASPPLASARGNASNSSSSGGGGFLSSLLRVGKSTFGGVVGGSISDPASQAPSRRGSASRPHWTNWALTGDPALD